MKRLWLITLAQIKCNLYLCHPKRIFEPYLQLTCHLHGRIIKIAAINVKHSDYEIVKVFYEEDIE